MCFLDFLSSILKIEGIHYSYPVQRKSMLGKSEQCIKSFFTSQTEIMKISSIFYSITKLWVSKWLLLSTDSVFQQNKLQKNAKSKKV